TTVLVVAAVALAHGIRRMTGRRAPDGKPGFLRAVAVAAVSVWAVFLAGSVVFGSSVNAVGWLVLGGAAGIVGWVGRPAPVGPRRGAVAGRTPDPAGLARAVRTATDEQLAELWQRSAAALRQSSLPASTGRYVEIRQLILDEAERRDPA